MSETDNVAAEVTDWLAAAISHLQPASLHPRLVERAQDLVLDHLGVSLRGATYSWSRFVREQVIAEQAAPRSTIYGAGRSCPRNAALANGTAAHAIELDDTHDQSLNHPGAVVIPAALAVAESERASGIEFLAAVVAGYETQCRIGAAVGERLITRGFHPTSTVGVFGATAAAAHVLKLSTRTLVSAFGTAASMSSGLMQFSQDAEGTMVKRMHAGLAAERGVLAATLARSGFLGPHQAVEGRFGFANVFAGGADLARITRDLGSRFEIEDISVKLYPCCRSFHALIEALAQCRATPGFSVGAVQSVAVFGPKAMIHYHMERRPQSAMAAQYSLPYTTAVALLFDPTDPAMFERPVYQRPDVLALADKIEAREDPVLESMFPSRYAGGAAIRMTDGKLIEHVILDSRSTPRNPIDRREIEAKFMRMTAGIVPAPAQAGIVHAVMTLHRSDSVGALADLLAAPMPGIAATTRTSK